MKKSTLKPIEQAQQKQVAGGSIHDNGQPGNNWWNWLGGATCGPTNP